MDKEKEEEGSDVEGSWAVVLAGRGDTSAFNRHVEVQSKLLSDAFVELPPFHIYKLLLKRLSIWAKVAKHPHHTFLPYHRASTHQIF